MLWVRADYADRLAIACAWIGAFLPWNATYAPLPDIEGVSLVSVYFPLFQARLTFGVAFAKGLRFVDPLSAAAFQAGRPLELAYRVWAVGAAVVALALVLSVAIYVVDTPSTEQRIDPVRLMGALLVLAGVVLAVAAYLILTRGFPGPSLPVGLVLFYVLGGVLLVVERVEPDAGGGDATGGA